ncbi:MAG: hypothetical protein NTZ46_11980 [Verrucomicrobia bacterium]|nr:hypothetical protein [Verrucomicrobiota bacterium]
MFTPMAPPMIDALAGSLLLALTLAPVLAFNRIEKSLLAEFPDEIANIWTRLPRIEQGALALAPMGFSR